MSRTVIRVAVKTKGIQSVIGESLAHYEVVGKLGAGGMGEVYRARDSKLGRDVALKLLPDAFAHDPDRLSRFEREAKVLASLNHPHIGAIFGIEQSDSKRFLVLELVEGEDLSQRISRGALPMDDVLLIARQITEALEVAHEQGIVHRDLKPANISINVNGTVKVLDFGLAKAMDPDASQSGDIMHSPTVLGSSPTVQGVILGTAAYMSPEQARGKFVDKRADIFAFGSVLFEMLTGQRTFSGETVSDTLASILARDPDWDLLPTSTPNSIKKLLHRCLDKDPARRLRDIGEARIVIEDVIAGKDERPGSEPTVESTPGSSRLLTGIFGAVALMAIAAAAVTGIKYKQATNITPEITRAFIPAPEASSFSLSPLHPGAAVISPNGRRITFSARQSDGHNLLFIREVDQVEARALSGTEGAGYPFWSPDSKHIGFIADGKLKRVDASGGPPLTLCEAPVGKGGTWNEAGTILFAPSFNTPIHTVAAAGGESSPVTKIRSDRGENSHRHPHFLPDGRHFLYFARGGGLQSVAGGGGNAVMLASIDGDSSRALVRSRSHAIYASGHILFVREEALMAQPFDLEKLDFTGDAFPIVEQVKSVPGAFRGVFSASDNGVLVYQTGEAQTINGLVRVNREGEEIAIIGDDATFSDPALSPDGQSVAVQILDERSNSWDIWIFDVRRGIRTRFTFDPTNDTDSAWSPDGKMVVFSSGRRGNIDIFRKPFGGSAEEELVLDSEHNVFVSSVSSDGKYVVYTEVSDTTLPDIWRLPFDGSGDASPVVLTEFSEFQGEVSPDSRWLAYGSTESGRSEVYVTPFPGPGRKWQISSNGGFEPKWRHDGKEIFYASTSEKLMSVELDYSDDTLIIGNETPLFDLRSGNEYSPSADGQSFVRTRDFLDDSTTPLTIVINWDAELQNQR